MPMKVLGLSLNDLKKNAYIIRTFTRLDLRREVVWQLIVACKNMNYINVFVVYVRKCTSFI
jgi:hypothetical protein